jgi:hypothetical protein
MPGPGRGTEDIKRIMKRLFTTLMLLAGLSYSAEDAFNLTDFTYYTCADKVDIYSSPDSNSSTLTVLPYGTEIKPIGDYITSKDGWTFAKVHIGDHEGYISDHRFFRLNKGQVPEPLITKLMLTTGNPLEFKNNYCEGEQHSVTTLLLHEKKIGFYLVKTAMKEGGETLLIDEKTGAKYRIYGGNLTFSPNSKRFLASSYDEYGQAYFLAIYSIVRRKPVVKFQKRVFATEGLGWDPTTVKWVSDDTIEYLAKTKAGPTTRHIRFNGKKWLEQ